MMFFDTALVIICHLITTNVALLSKAEPKSASKVVRICAVITVLMGAYAIVDIVYRAVTHQP